jgi:2-C-methyl-D-erythritol 4-phosphate cytidylyltransferase
LEPVKKAVVIVAGGSGSRMQSTLPKQFILLNGKPLIFHTIEKFHKTFSNIQIIVVLPESYFDYWNELRKNYEFTLPVTLQKGGQERFHSVKNGVKCVSKDVQVVGIQDAVRPLVSMETIRNCYQIAYEKGNAVPVVPVIDSLRKINEFSSKSVDRNLYKIVQTPQCFRIDLIHKMYQQDYQPFFTDDASVLEHLGEPIYLTEGNRENIKITTPEDLKIASCLLQTGIAH